MMSQPLPDADPILIARARWSRVAKVGRKVGGMAYLLALVLFMAAVLADYPTILIQLVTFFLIGGSIVLGPAIVLGYMVRAAQQDDPEISPN